MIPHNHKFTNISACLRFPSFKELFYLVKDKTRFSLPQLDAQAVRSSIELKSWDFFAYAAYCPAGSGSLSAQERSFI